MSTVDSTLTPQDAPFFNIVAPEFNFKSPEVALAQAKSWYAKTPIGLLVLRYAEAQELLRDQRLHINTQDYLAMNGITDGPIYDWLVQIIGNRTGADHRRLRSLVNKAFTPRTISNLLPFIRANAERLTEHLASVEVCEFVEDFGNPLPLAVMCQLLGVPAQDYDTFRVWTEDIGLVFSLAHGGDIAERVERAVVGLSGYVDSLIADKKASPADDLISALVAAQEIEGRVSEDELNNLIVTLVFAAHDTTRHQLANAMVTFAEHPDQWALLAEHPELGAQAVEEVIRWFPSSTNVFRFAVEDLDYGGLHITKGTYLMICVVMAQRDPTAFPGGDSFDITVARETPLLQFGGGPHYCLGAGLARAELNEALSVLASRLGPPSIAGPITLPHAIGICGPHSLPLRFG